MEKFALQKIKEKAQKHRTELLENIDAQINELIEEVVQEIEDNRKADAPNSKSYKKKDGELPDKEFINRDSILTELLEVNHIRTIHHIFIAIMIVFSLNNIICDFFEKGIIFSDFDLIFWNFGKFPIVITAWVGMTLSTTVLVFATFQYWSCQRQNLPRSSLKYFDGAFLLIYIAYQCAFLILPIKTINEQQLPPASAFCIACEQVRYIMKSHAFIRYNIPHAYRYKPHSDDDKDTQEELCPDFSKYLYFLFAPTLVYRPVYPRSSNIRWFYVFTNFLQVFASLIYIYYILARFCVPVFKNFTEESVTPRKFLMSAFGCMLPGTLILFIAFFAILHSWLNAFAEMLRFGDRMFYKDWWNSSSFSNYYRTWNVVVHDWLYQYVYKDCYLVFGHLNRAIAMAIVFLLSAVVHEYILIVCFRMFFPVLFLMFGGAGFAFVFLNDRRYKRTGNVFMWVALMLGTGLLVTLYSMEWYARQNCPITSDTWIVDYLIPRSLTCNYKF